MSAGGGCEAVMTARIVKFRQSGKLYYGKNFVVKIKGSVYKIYVRPAILHGSNAWCLKEGNMAIL